MEIVLRFYVNMKGIKIICKVLYNRFFWCGGMEFFVFNKFEEFVE